MNSIEEQLLQHVQIDPSILVGKPVICGTRIPVELTQRMLAQGISENEILRDYPRLGPKDIRAALGYAAQMLADEDILPLDKFI